MVLFRRQSARRAAELAMRLLGHLTVCMAGPSTHVMEEAGDTRLGAGPWHPVVPGGCMATPEGSS